MATHSLLTPPQFSTISVPILREGDAGLAVVELQKLLNEKGANLTTDGIFSPKTTVAVVQFQKQHNLICDGVVGRFTWVALRKPTPLPINLVNVCLLYDPYRYPHQTYAIKWLAGQLSSAVFREFLQRWDDVPVKPDATLHMGHYGLTVKRLQGLLKKAGYELLEDGIFGPATQAIVLQFQKKHGLVADGIAGELTWTKFRQVVERRYLQDTFYFYQSRYHHQTAALEWLQNQLPTAILREFGSRWRNRTSLTRVLR